MHQKDFRITGIIWTNTNLSWKILSRFIENRTSGKLLGRYGVIGKRKKTALLYQGFKKRYNNIHSSSTYIHLS
jgi:hypothetical protein